MQHSLYPDYELNHASMLPTLGVTKSKAKRTFLKGEFLEEMTT